jgi:hypothetical protein
VSTLLYIDLDNRAAGLSLGNTDWTPPVLNYGERLTFSLRPYKNINGSPVEQTLQAGAIRAGIMNIDHRPISGSFKLLVGEGDSQQSTDSITYPCLAHEIQEAIEKLESVVSEYGNPLVDERDGSFLIRWSSNTPVELGIYENLLEPDSLASFYQRQIEGQWITELMFRQAPLAWTNIFTNELPPPPSIERVRAGGNNAGVSWNEIQSLTVPREFRGAYYIQRDLLQTKLLSREDGVADIQGALNEWGLNGFRVYNPTSGVAYIEFVGALAGINHPVMQVYSVNAPTGDLTFSLQLENLALHELLRKQEQVDLLFDVELDIYDTNSPTGVKTIPIFRVPVKIQRRGAMSEWAVPPAIPWIKPRSLRYYHPFSEQQVLTGQQHYMATIGNGQQTLWTIHHGLDTDEIASITVWKQTSSNRERVDPSTYSATIISLNAVNLEFPAPPGNQEMQVFITTAGPKSAFQDHMHSIEQITGLGELVFGIDGRMNTIESLVPQINPGLLWKNTQSKTGQEMVVEKIVELYPGRFAPDFKMDKGLSDVDLSKLPRTPGLLPAVHNAVVSSVTSLPESPSIGQVVMNSGTSDLSIVGWGGRRGSVLQPNETAAWDGRAWYKVRQEGETSTYHPVDFERELFLFYISGNQLRVGRTLEVLFNVNFRLFSTDKNRKTRAQWVVKVEHGDLVEEEDPDPTGTNIKGILWRAPMLEERIVITDTLQPHTFGVMIQRLLLSYKCDSMKYGYWTGAQEQAPTVPGWYLRARLTRFDTEDGLPDPRGFVGFEFISPAESKEGASVKIL